MRETYFVIRVFILSLFVIVLLQFKMGGESLETKATQMFGSSQAIESIRTSTRHAIKKIKSLINN